MKKLILIFIFLIWLAASVDVNAAVLKGKNESALPVDFESWASTMFTMSGEQLFESHNVISPTSSAPKLWNLLPSKTILDYKVLGSLSTDFNNGDSTLMIDKAKFIYDMGTSNNYGLILRQDKFPFNEWAIGVIVCPENISKSLKDLLISFAVVEGGNYVLDFDGKYPLDKNGNYKINYAGLLRFDSAFNRSLGDWSIEVEHPTSPGGDVSLIIKMENVRDKTIVGAGIKIYLF